MAIKQHTPNRWIKEEITNEIRKYFEIDENEDIVQEKKKKTFRVQLKPCLEGNL